jgi:hypothetical protein
LLFIDNLKKIKNKKYQFGRTVPKYNKKIVEGDKINTLTHKCITCLATDTSVKIEAGLNLK